MSGSNPAGTARPHARLRPIHRAGLVGSVDFLGVNDTRWIPRSFLLAEENGHELIHAGIGEKKIGGGGHERRRGHNRVLLFAKEIEKALTDFGAGHNAGIKRDI